MSALAKHILAMADDAYLCAHPEWEAIVEEAMDELIEQPSHTPLAWAHEFVGDHERLAGVKCGEEGGTEP